MSPLPYEITLSEKDKQNAISMLSEPESEEEMKASISVIQKWIDEDPHYKGKCDEKTIIRFVRNCKYRPERVQVKLKSHLEFRAKEVSWFKNRDPQHPDQVELLKTGTVLPLHGHDKEGRTVILIRTSAYDPRKNSFLDVFKVAHLIMDLLMELDETISVYGVQAILDLSGNTVSHVLQLTPSVVRKAVHAWQNCYPVRTKRIDFFNTPIYAQAVLNIFLQFMSEKMKSRVHIFGSKKADLHKIVDPSMLPIEYGGTSGTIQELMDFWINRLNEHRDWILAAEVESVN